MGGGGRTNGAARANGAADGSRRAGAAAPARVPQKCPEPPPQASPGDPSAAVASFSPSSWGSECAARALEACLAQEAARAPQAWSTLELGAGCRCEVSANVFTWDSARLLARWVADHPDAVRGQHCVELGAGTALPSFAAALSGASQAVATDCEPSALASVRSAAEEGARRRPETAQRLAALGTQVLDWFAVAKSADEAESAGCSGADVLLAADVNYYSSAIPALIATVDACLRPGGTLLLASRAGRISLSGFIELLRMRGFAESAEMRVLHTSESIEGHEDAVYALWTFTKGS